MVHSLMAITLCVLTCEATIDFSASGGFSYCFLDDPCTASKVKNCKCKPLAILASY